MNLQKLLSSAVIDSIAETAGTSPEDTTSVLAAALPKLMGAMATNASTDEGADSLAEALERHAAADSRDGALEEVDPLDGAKILRKIFGVEKETVEESVSEESGVDPGNVGNILAHTAPLLLSALSGEKKKKRTPNRGISGLLLTLLGGAALTGRTSGRGKKNPAGGVFDLAGALLGAGPERGRSPARKRKPDGGDLLTGLAGLLDVGAEKESRRKPARKKEPDGEDLLTGLAGLLDVGAEKESRRKPARKKKPDAGDLLTGLAGLLGDDGRPAPGEKSSATKRATPKKTAGAGKTAAGKPAAGGSRRRPVSKETAKKIRPAKKKK